MMTTAARAGCGRYWSRPGTRTSMTAIAAAPTSPVSCDFAPARSATAVRDPLVLTGKPPNSPAATLALPDPHHLPGRVHLLARPGREARTRWRSCRRARRWRSRSRRRRAAAGPRWPALGMLNGGSPLGSTPDEARRPVAPRSKTTTTTIEAITPTSTLGIAGSQRCSASIRTRLNTPDGDRGRDGLARGHALDELDQLADEALGVHREPEQLRELAHQDREGQAVHVADLGGLGEEVRDEPEACAARPRASARRPSGRARTRRRRPRSDPRWRRPAAAPSPRSSAPARSPAPGRGSATARRSRTPMRHRIEV